MFTSDALKRPGVLYCHSSKFNCSWIIAHCWHRQLQINGLVLCQGKFVWPLSPTNTLVLNQIQADLRFQTNDTWSLDNFQADFAGAKTHTVW